MISQTQPQFFNSDYLQVCGYPSLGKPYSFSFWSFQISSKDEKNGWGKGPSFTDCLVTLRAVDIVMSVLLESLRSYLSPFPLGLADAHGDQTVLEVIRCHVILTYLLLLFLSSA